MVPRMCNEETDILFAKGGVMKRLLILFCISILMTISARASAWYCFEQYEGIGACFAAKDECSDACLRWVRYFDSSAIACGEGVCSYQPGAVCFNFYDIVNRSSNEECADSFRGCEFFRRLILAQSREYRVVMKCTVQ